MARGMGSAVAVREGSVVQRSDVVKAARTVFLSGQRLDMGTLASRAGIGRATLYRWTGGREPLLAEVVGSMATATIAHADDAARGTPGPDRLAAVVERYFLDVASNPQLRGFIEREPDVAKRILISVHSHVHTRAVAAFEEIIRQEQTRATFTLALDPILLAQTLIRIGEAFLFADLAADAEPDSWTAIVVSRQLLGATPKSDQALQQLARPNGFAAVLG